MSNDSYPPQNVTDAQQSLRMQRFVLSGVMYCMSLVPLSLSVLQHHTPVWVFGVWLVLAVSYNLGFYLAIRSGFNLRFRDPSLTLAQMVAAISLVLFAQGFSGPVRGAYLVVLMIIIVFGCLRLHRRQLLWVGLITAAAYGLTLPLVKMFDGQRFDGSVELVYWTAFLVYLPCIAVLAGHISQLRKRVMDSNAQLQVALSQVTELATRDELTGLPNRRYLMARLEQEKNRVDRGAKGFIICLLDLDHFKRINDRYGHAGGDVVLREFANCVRPLLRVTDLMARYGGEEFMLLLPETAPDTARACLARLQDQLTGVSFAGLPADLRITTSVGIAHYQAAESLTDLIERADKALYIAKERGRNRIEVAPAPAVSA
jgi:diguanylate cyclase (GGDEF)-like protein